ncbi:MAG: peroxiredoxin-like family protein [Solirubrobacteraceae bacterium]
MQDRRRTAVGALIAAHELVDISGEPVPVPDPESLVHLQFRRYAGCPFCTLHLGSIVQRHDDIRAAGIREVAVFHSTAEDLRSYQPELPFPVVADPEKRLYREFGVGSSLRALADPRAWVPAVRGIRRKPDPLSGDHRTGHLGRPADFLLASDGRVLARKYGAHAYDQWTVDELLGLAASA